MWCGRYGCRGREPYAPIAGAHRPFAASITELTAGDTWAWSHPDGTVTDLLPKYNERQGICVGPDGRVRARRPTGAKDLTGVAGSGDGLAPADTNGKFPKS